MHRHLGAISFAWGDGSHRHRGAARLLSPSSLLPRKNSSSRSSVAQRRRQQQHQLLLPSPSPPSPYHLHFYRRFSNGVIFSLRGITVRSDTDTAVAVTNGEHFHCVDSRSLKWRSQRFASSSTSTTGTGAGGDDRNISALSVGSAPFTNYIAGRRIRNNKMQQLHHQSGTTKNGAILPLEEQTHNNHTTTQHRPHRNTITTTPPPSQLREHQLPPRTPNIPIHSLGNSTLSATDLHRWHLNQQREEKEKKREKYNQQMRQAAVDHQSITKRGHSLGGGSIVALQSATVKYRQLRQQQRQQQISEKYGDISAINVSDGTSSRNNSHQLKSNPSAKTIPISNDDYSICRSSEPELDTNVESDGSSTATNKSGWFAFWFGSEKKD